MAILIVGGNHVTSLKQQISTLDQGPIEHWNGRKKGFSKRLLPGSTRLVVIVCDCVNHCLANSVKNQAARKGVPLIFCRRSVNELKNKLLAIIRYEKGCCCNPFMA